MTITSGFFPSVDGDRVYTAKQFGQIFDGVISDGVFKDFLNALEVVQSTGMYITVKSGRAWFDSSWLYNSFNESLAVTPSHATLDRIDLVIIEVNETAGVRAGTIKMLDGTPAASPVAPTLTNDDTVHQYSLAQIYVSAAVTSIYTADITDLRGETDCPWALGIVSNVAFDRLDELEDASDMGGHNLVRNYPDIYKDDGAMPNWWLAQNATVTEEDATGEGISDSPNERVIKIVNTAAGGYAYQRMYLADEESLKVGDTVTLGAWVRTATGGGYITASVVDDGSGGSSTVQTTTIGSMVYLEVTHTISSGATYVSFTIGHSLNAVTVYVADIQFNKGDRALSFKPRGLRPGYFVDGPVNGVNPSVTTFADADFTAYTSPLTVMLEVRVVYSNSTVAGRQVVLQTKGKSDPIFACTVQNTSYESRVNIVLMCDDSQIIEWRTTGGSGETENLSIVGAGVFWEWE